MSVIDANKLRLLRMKEKLISLNNNDMAALEEYKKVACDIDIDLFTSIADKIREHRDYANYPLEEQLEFLTGLEKDFDEYYNYQKNIIMTCNRYFIQGFELTDASLIRMNEVRKRINAIKKYLDNEVIIEKNRMELDRLNSEYITEEQKSNMFQDRVALLDAELKNNVLKAEGRKAGISGNIEYVSIVTEAEDLGIDLKKILDDNDILDREISKVEAASDEANERLKSAQICYENNLNASYRDIYLNIRKETIDIKYRLTFLKIIQLICSNNVTYKQANQKRTELFLLIKDRIALLEQLGVKYLYDPFDRIGLKEQIDIIHAYGNNNDRIKEIRKTIDDISSENDEKITENKKFSDYFKVNIELYGSDAPVLVDDISVPEEVIDNFYSHNKVMRIENAPANFKLERAHEKTHEVIKRIYDVMGGTTKKDMPYDVNPSLVITKDDDMQVFDNFDNEGLDQDDDLVVNDDLGEFIPEENLSVSVPENTIFSDTIPFDETSNVVNSNDNLFEDTEPFAVEDKKDTTSSDLFQDIEPFEEPQLFANKYDDGAVFTDQAPLFQDDIVSNVNMPTQSTNTSSVVPQVSETTGDSLEQNVEMPDVFWEMSNEPVVDENQNDVSFDDQIAALINSEEDSKVKKLVS